MKNNKKTVIFDFDGTIADSFDYASELIYGLAKKKKLEFNLEKIKEFMRTRKISDVIKDLNMSKLHVAMAMWTIRRKMKKKIFDVKPFKGMKDALYRLKDNFNLILVTSNSKRNVDGFFAKNDFRCFDFASPYINSEA